MNNQARDWRILRHIGKNVESTGFRPRLKEEAVALAGPRAIGKYGEEVARNFLKSCGIVPLAQYPYKDEFGHLHLADFYDDSTRTAFEVKTGAFRSSSIYEFKLEQLQYALTSHQFDRVIFINVSFLGRLGFSGRLEKRVREFGVIILNQRQMGLAMGTAGRREAMSSVTSFLKVVEQRYPGPAPAFEKAHAFMLFVILGNEGIIGRQALSESTGLGEGSVRTILKKLRRGGYVVSDIQGWHLTELGNQLYRTIERKLVGPTILHESSLSVGPLQSAVLIRSTVPSLGSGIEQRDSAVRVGAHGATTFAIRSGRFSIPGGSDDCERDFPGAAWNVIREVLKPVNNDVVIVCGAADEATARLGALAAALSLL